MTTPNGPASDDSFWRRPSAPHGQGSEPQGLPSETGVRPAVGPVPEYPGPPRNTRPPRGWRPPVHLIPQPPRRLPAQDVTRLDGAERNARTVTYGVGLIAGAVLVVLVCLLCSRVLF